MSYKLVASLLSHKNATPEMAERIFLWGHKNSADLSHVASCGTLSRIAAASRVFNKQLFDKYKHDPNMLDLMNTSKHFKRFVDDHIRQHGIGKTLEHPSQGIRKAATERPEFDEWLKQPDNMDIALKHPDSFVHERPAERPEFKDWLSNYMKRNSIEKMLVHPSEHVHYTVLKTPGFKDWLNNHIRQHGIEKALEHPSDYVKEAVINSPEFEDYVSNRIKQHGIEKTLEHPNWFVQDATTNTPEFKEWLKQPGAMDIALNHPNSCVGEAAYRAPEFKDWLSNHIKQHGIENTLEHPNGYVRHAADEAQQEQT